MTENKRCRHCQKNKPTGEFGIHRKHKDGLSSYCRSCNCMLAKRWYAKNREHTIKKRLMKWNKLPKETRYVISRKYWLRKRGWTPEEFDSQKEIQGSLCANPVCLNEATHADHDHKTGRARWILCSGCNSAIGFVGDDPDKLVALAEMLRRWQED